MKYQVVTTFLSAGPIAATASADGSKLAIDFADLRNPTEALRLGIPAESLQTVIVELLRIQTALEDPASGIHLPPEATH